MAGCSIVLYEIQSGETESEAPDPQNLLQGLELAAKRAVHKSAHLGCFYDWGGPFCGRLFNQSPTI